MFEYFKEIRNRIKTLRKEKKIIRQTISAINELDRLKIVDNKKTHIPEILKQYTLKRYKNHNLGGIWCDGFELINSNNKVLYRAEYRNDKLGSGNSYWYWRDILFKKNIEKITLTTLY